jgi:hypothetical protein
VAWIFGFFAIATAFAAVRWSRDNFDRWFFFGCCALNLAALIYVIATKDPYALRLMPASPNAF